MTDWSNFPTHLSLTKGTPLSENLNAGTPSAVTVTIEDDDKPARRPVVLQAQAGDASLLAVWSYLGEAEARLQPDSFDVEHRVKGDTDWTSVSANTNLHEQQPGRYAHTVSGLTNATTYQIRVRARNAAGPGPWSQRRPGHTEGAPVAPRPHPQPSPQHPPQHCHAHASQSPGTPSHQPPATRSATANKARPNGRSSDSATTACSTDSQTDPQQ